MPFSKKGFLAKLRRLPESEKEPKNTALVAEDSETAAAAAASAAAAGSTSDRPIPAIRADDAGAAIDDLKQTGTDYGSGGSTSPDSTTVISGRSRRVSLDPQSPSPTPSVDKLSVSFCPDLTLSADNMGDSAAAADAKVRFSKDHLSAITSDGLNDDDDDDEYSESIEMLMRCKEGGRRRSIRRSPKRMSSPLGSDSESSGKGRRRSSTMTSASCDETQISIEDEEMTEDQIFESIRLHKEVLEQVKRQPWQMKKRLKVVRKAKAYIKKHEGVLQERLAHSKNTKDIMTRYTLIFERYWEKLKREGMNLAKNMIPWEMRIKRIESHFGSVVASYFTFLRWVFWMNIVMCVFISCFVIVPEVLGADRLNAGTRKEVPKDEADKAFNLQQLWDFEGFLKYSPIFYGYYTNSEKTRQGYRIPFAYFLTLLGVYGYSFAAILRRMAENTRLSKLSDKDEDCAFTWKLYTGWDYMIGNAETADNKVAALLMSFKENILEEREKKKEDRNWKIFGLRFLANFVVLLLLISSAYAVVLVVKRSQEPEADSSWWRQNEVTVTVSLISTIYPNLFDVLGTIEHNHPRIQLRWQLGRIMVLYLLNLYTLIFALFSKVDLMSAELISLRPNTTMQPIISSTTPSTPMYTSSFGGPFGGHSLKPLWNESDGAPSPFVNENIRDILNYLSLSTQYHETYKVNDSCIVYRIYCDKKRPMPRNDSSTLVSTATTDTYYNDDDGRLFWPNISNISITENPGYNEPSTPNDYRDFDDNARVLWPSTNVTQTDTWLTKKSRHKSKQKGSLQSANSRIKTLKRNLIRYGYNISNISSFTNNDYLDLGDENITPTNPSMSNDSYDTDSLLAADDPNPSTGTPTYDVEYHDDCTFKFGDKCYILKCLDSIKFSTVKVPQVLRYNTSATTSYEYNLCTGVHSVTYTATEDSSKNVTNEVDEVNSDELDYQTQKRLSKLCWETMFGQELVKLTVMDLVMTVANILLTDFIRALFVRIMNHCWFWDLEKQFPGYGDFKIAENILHLVNNQGMIWMGMFFSPGIPGVNMVKLVIILYIRSWAVLTCNIPHETVFKASRSNNFYYALLLLMLFLCTLPVGYAVVRLRPSWHCGPFSQHNKIYYIFTSYVSSVLPDIVIRGLDYVASPGFIIPVLLLFILVIYYLSSVASSLREANKDLKIQLRRERTEERRKVFQMADDSTNLGSSAFANAIGSVLRAKNIKISGMNQSIFSVTKNMKDGTEETPKGELPIRSVLTRETISTIKKSNSSVTNSDTLKKEKILKTDVETKGKSEKS